MKLKPAELRALLKALNGKHALFAEEYLVDGKPHDAAKRAGFTGKQASISVTASRLLKKANVAKYVAHMRAVRAEKLEITADKVVAGIAKLAFYDIRDFLSFEDGEVKIKDLADIDNPDAIKEIEIIQTRGGGQIHKLKLTERIKALELLGKHTAIFTENINLTNNGKDLPEPTQVTNVFINHRGPGQEIDVDKKD